MGLTQAGKQGEAFLSSDTRSNRVSLPLPALPSLSFSISSTTASKGTLPTTTRTWRRTQAQKRPGRADVMMAAREALDFRKLGLLFLNASLTKGNGVHKWVLP